MAFIDTPDFDPRARSQDNAIPRFYTEAYKDEFATAKRGQPVFHEREMVEILVPGDRKNEVHQIVNEGHKKRWPKAYEAFSSGREGGFEGTPIDQLPGITKGQIEELRHSRVLSIEALAGMSDDLLNKAVSMGQHALREKAQRWLEVAAGAAPMEKLAAENVQLKSTMDAMQAQLDEFKRLLDAQAAQAAHRPVTEG